ncbi:MAG: Nudix family hydrolase [Sulfuricaulis sp.]|uniref:Nudix family hydrolase n=1 Tax=Sulfuricaulis sp. TaxID=2003553 RepID=UPI0025F2B080|nr:Nudix family hydrolase [Sulfuricaulis sp.]MCR4346212.1 Nudix family hydrolase [Sulfuricaulis sp.]
MIAVAELRQVLDVAVAVIQREDGRVLLAQRPAGKPWEGYWEFPGGKIESGESADQALARELHEELGVDLDRVYPWVTQEYAYPEKRVRLHFYRVLAWHGQPHGREGQGMSWENPAAINIGPLLPANDKVLRALSLPSVYAITNARKYGEVEFMQRLKAALEKGVRLIQVREHEMPPEQLESFSRRVVTLAHEYDARVLINSDETLARRCGADGVHLPSEHLMRLKQRPGTRIWAASCHDAAELAQAARLSADFVVLSPVLPTLTHPDAAGMGWGKFAGFVNNYPLPVYALGGMKRELLDTAMKHGAHGVSLLSGIW